MGKKDKIILLIEDDFDIRNGSAYYLKARDMKLLKQRMGERG